MAQPSRWGDRRRLRIGLLGGSFNPAHEGHRQVALALARRLRLHQVWLLVSPGNPLKPTQGMAPLPDRLASARRIADGRRLVATDIERALGTRYTIDTLTALRRRFPRMRFVLLMGADSFASLPHWRGWTRLVAGSVIAVHPRPGANRQCLAGTAAHRARHARRPATAAAILAAATPPAWSFLPLPCNALSATALRAAGHGLNTGAHHLRPAGRPTPLRAPPAQG